MNTALNEAICSICGNPLPKAVLGGLCPACLLRTANETKTAGRNERAMFRPPTLERMAVLFPQLSVLQLIGAGGMGAVYKARQPALDRFVALKVLPPGTHEGANFTERFNREARALARLNHPNIVTVHEFGHVEGLHYFIMEYVDGANLRQLERAGRLSPREALQVIPQICDALQYAHDEGVVHRDIKPENVLIDRKGRVKIADFGLAKILDIDPEELRLTAEGQVMGTPHYMAPEQVERPLSVDHRADIYSLGVVFYEMLTGDLPLGKFPPPSRKVSLDVRLDEVVLRALENDPERRYQQASEVKSKLHTITDTPASAPPSTPSTTPVNAREPVERFVHWAGIPLVRDRNGEREISWEGGLTAVCLGGLMAAGGLWLFQRVTGHPSPSFMGIPSLITIFILGAGFRRAMNAPLPESKTVMTDQGTVILNPKRRWLNWSTLALGSILFAVFAWCMFQNYGIPAIRRALTAPKASSVASCDKDSSVLFADLPRRGRAEVLAVGYRDSAPNQWWRPDGTLITKEYWEIENPGEAVSHNTTNRDIILSVSDLPGGADQYSFELEPAAGYVSGGQVVKNGTALPGATGLRIGVPPALRSITLRMGFGLEPWRTFASIDPREQSNSMHNSQGDPNWHLTLHKVSDTVEGLAVTVIMSPESRDWSRRIIALDTDGNEHFYSLGSGTSSGDSITWTFTFRGLALAKVKGFSIQERPVHWVQFDNIRLNPKQPLPTPQLVAFKTPVQITTSDFIDFDNAKVLEEPPGESKNFFEGMGEIVAWMERVGVDAAVGNGELQPLGMFFVTLENSDWDDITPTGLTTRLHQGMFRPTELRPWKNGELPSTFGFRTREGGTGVMQLLAFEEARPGVTMRFKLLQRPGLNSK